MRFETEPGRQLQADWATERTVVARQEVDVHFLVSTLSYSRRFRFWGTGAEDAEQTYEGLVRAFSGSAVLPRRSWSTRSVVFVRTQVAHGLIPTRFAPLLLRTAAS